MSVIVPLTVVIAGVPHVHNIEIELPDVAADANTVTATPDRAAAGTGDMK